MNKPIISIIVAVGENRAIGKNNGLLWNIPEDMEHFRSVTRGHAVIMGQKTFESIGRPLPQRTNVVLTQDPDFHPDGCVIAHSVEEALTAAKKAENEEIFFIGGGMVYQQAIPLADRLYVTVVKGNFEADTFFPDYSMFKKVVSRRESRDENYTYTFFVLEK